MGDPSKFSSITEYYIVFYAIAILVLSELAIWLFSSKGRGKEKRKSADSGTVWLIIIGWCWGVIAGAFSVAKVYRILYVAGYCRIFAIILEWCLLY